jgi:hypothetical protein
VRAARWIDRASAWAPWLLLAVAVAVITATIAMNWSVISASISDAWGWYGDKENRDKLTPIGALLGASLIAWAALRQAGIAARRHYAHAAGAQYARLLKLLEGTMSVSKKRGRPSKYTETIAAEICSRLAEGESLRSICSDPHMPTNSIVVLWAREESEARPAFVERYARARRLGYERLAEELIAISDDPCMFDGKPDNVFVQRARLMSDNRKWLLSRMLPRQFGDRVTQELVGDAGAPLVTRIELVPVAPAPRPEDDLPAPVTPLRALSRP